jgi:hypothetical protein
MDEKEESILARAHFFFPPKWKELSGWPNNLGTAIPDQFHLLMEASRRNILGCVAMVSMHFRMAISSLHQRRYQAIHTAERIRARAHIQENGTVPDRAEIAARETANRRMEEELYPSGDRTGTFSRDWWNRQHIAILRQSSKLGP